MTHLEDGHRAFAQPIRTGVFALGILLFAGAGSGGLIVVGVVELVSVAAVSAYLLWAQYRWTVPFQFTLSLKQPLYLIREGAAIGLSNALWAFMLYTPVIMLASLITADLRFNRLETTRALLDNLAAPIFWLADIPARLGEWGSDRVQSRAALLEENERLQREHLVLPAADRTRSCT